MMRSHLADTLAEDRAGCRAKAAKTEHVDMQNQYSAQRLSQSPKFRVRCRVAAILVAIFGATLLFANGFSHSAQAQNGVTQLAQATAPDASPAPAAPSVSEEPTVPRATLPQDLSPWGMFLNADLVVKLVIIGLAFASLVTWTVWLAKTIELRKARVEVRDGLKILNGAATLAQAHEALRNGTTAVAQLMQSAGQEIRLSAGARGDGLKERVALVLERIEMGSSRKMARGTGVLATIGSTAPFVGLFGTVWGIMNAFIGISNAHTTNLAVVAPGIAQALLATALGLIAAIPAVVIYNALARQTAHYKALLGDASAQVMRLVSRDLDRAKQPAAAAQPAPAAVQAAE